MLDGTCPICGQTVPDSDRAMRLHYPDGQTSGFRERGLDGLCTGSGKRNPAYVTPPLGDGVRVPLAHFR